MFRHRALFPALSVPAAALRFVVGFAGLIGSGAPVAAQIYVANANADSVLVFDPAVAGAQPPLQEITATPSAMDLASSVAVHVGRDELFVAGRNGDTLFVLDLDATGAATPLRTLGGVATTIDTPWDLEVDWERDELYVLSKDASEILVFGILAAGNMLPARTIATSPPWPTTTVDFDLDLVHGEIAVADRTPGAAAIHFLPLLSDGVAAPVRSISGAATGLTDPFSVAVDPVHDEIYVVNGTSVRVFARTASGNVAPLRVLSGAATGISGTRGVDVDPFTGEISVLRTLPEPALLFFARTADGNTAPLRAITGAATHFNGPSFHSYFPWLVFADGFDYGTADGWSS
ncbi:MAG: hypothetical protein ABIV06_04660, partial [Thermoanaerobaculia bacterium]